MAKVVDRLDKIEAKIMGGLKDFGTKCLTRLPNLKSHRVHLI